MSINSEKNNIINKLNSSKFHNLIEFYNINNVILFGSLVTDEFNEESDVDIAILSSEPLSLDTILKLELFLENYLERDIDIIDLKNSDLNMFVKIKILNSGKVIYSKNPHELEDFKTQVEWIYRENEDYIYFRKRDVLYE